MKALYGILAISLLGAVTALGVSQTGKFRRPWNNKGNALVLDSYAGNSIDWDQLATDNRVAGVIHKASERLAADNKYGERKAIAKKEGYLWGSYHLARPGNPAEQADFYLKTANPERDEVIALDLESLGDMSADNARVFLKRVREKTGRYPMVYANPNVVKAISDRVGRDDVFSRTPLWYARFRDEVTDFPQGTWDTYTLWQFSSEINCKPEHTSSCPYLVPGTKTDMDINVYYGSVDELRIRWPFTSN